MTYQQSPRITGLNITVGSFLPRTLLPSLSGESRAAIDLADENKLAVCVYNPSPVNPFPIPPRGVDLPMRLSMLSERDVTLYVISGLSLPRLASWKDQVQVEAVCLCDAAGEFANVAGIPIKQVGGRNFRTHASFVLQEDRVLAVLLETDPVVNFEHLLAALDIAEGREAEEYTLPDLPWYTDQEKAYYPPPSSDDEFLEGLLE